VAITNVISLDARIDCDDNVRGKKAPHAPMLALTEFRVSEEGMRTLGPHEIALLREVRLSDEDHGGLSGAELSVDEYDAMKQLCELGLVEAVGEYGEAPDGEEDEREAGASAVVYRITQGGVLVLSEETS
jgi:hypothetical protein